MTPTAGVSSMVERVARIAHAEMAGGDPEELIHHPWQKSWEEPTQRRWEQWTELAEAMIKAMREPTEEMIQAVAVSPAPRHRWHAMIDTALSQNPLSGT